MDQVALDARPSILNQWSPAEIAVGCIAAVAAVASVVFLALTLSEVFVVSLPVVIVVGAVGVAVLLAAAVFLTVMKCCSRASNSPEEKSPIEDANILNQIKNLPNLLADLSSRLKDEDRLEVLKDRMKEDYPTDQDYVDLFKKDMERGVTFVIRDSTSSENDDFKPQPSNELSQDEKFATGTKVLQNLLSNESDKKWEKVLQLVATQTSLNNLFDGPMMMFNATAASSAWIGENGGYHVLRAAFPDALPPIYLEIIRNETTKEIEALNVRVEGSLDIISYNSSISINADKKIRQEEAIQGSLTYRVTLDENDRPIISDLHSNLETNI